ncbi:MAG: guanylate kinase [Chlamydiales bacterium]
MKKGLVFVVSAPAGTGKTTLVRMLMEEFHHVVDSISYTTRLPRANEVPGRDYNFITVDEFKAKIAEGEFLEYAEVFHQFYGTSKKFVDGQQEKGKHVILVIDTQGALQLKGELDAVFIFISPPSLDELRARLCRRKSETEEAIETRLSWAEEEMALAGQYDYHIVNDHLKTAYDALRSILIAEEHRNR